MAKKNILANNPLFNTVAEDDQTEQTTTAAAEAPKKMGRPRKKDLVRDNSAQEGLTEDYTRATFILKVSALEAVKNYAYTKRIPIKDALTEIIESFIATYESNPDNEPLLKKQ